MMPVITHVTRAPNGSTGIVVSPPSKPTEIWLGAPTWPASERAK